MNEWEFPEHSTVNHSSELSTSQFNQTWRESHPLNPHFLSTSYGSHHSDFIVIFNLLMSTLEQNLFVASSYYSFNTYVLNTKCSESFRE